LIQDEILARKLEEEERKLSLVPSYPYENYDYYNYNNYSNSFTNKKRNHALSIHNQYCSCNELSTWNNNHIFGFHAKYCGCNLYTKDFHVNEGKRHQHCSKCCTLNHLHTNQCKCFYRDHIHDQSCCLTIHKHTMYCNCSHK